MSTKIQLATYNIHRCIGADRHQAPERIVSVIRELQADVIALQEVDSTVGQIKDFTQHLANALGYEAFEGTTMTRHDSQYGNVLMTRLPVESVKRIDLSVEGRERRGAILAKFLVGASPVLVVATHLGLNPAERRWQTRQLLTTVFHEVRSPVPQVRVLMGDLNEWFLWGRPMRWLRTLFGESSAPGTFPVGWPLLALDRIWIEPHDCRRALYAHCSSLSRVASDHLPLVACIEVSAEEPQVPG